MQIVTKSERQKISVETRDFNGRDYSPAGPLLNAFEGELYLHALHSSNSPKSLKSHRECSTEPFLYTWRIWIWLIRRSYFRGASFFVSTVIGRIFSYRGEKHSIAEPQC